MDRDAEGFVPRKGMSVIGSDGERVGDIDVVERAYVIVQQGLFPQDYYIPISAITSHDDDAVYLDITKDDAMARGLGNPNVAFSEPAAVTDAGHAHKPAPAEADVDADAEAYLTGLTIESTDDAIIADDQAARAGEHHNDHRAVELHQEELTVTTRPVERGVLRVHKDVVEERQTFEVPAVEEEVIVTRRPVNREIGEGETPFEEVHIELPLHGQAVQIETQAHIVEEIELGKTARQQVEQVTETLRREGARIEGDGVVLDAAHDGPDHPDTSREPMPSGE